MVFAEFFALKVVTPGPRAFHVYVSGSPSMSVAEPFSVRPLVVADAITPAAKPVSTLGRWLVIVGVYFQMTPGLLLPPPTSSLVHVPTTVLQGFPTAGTQAPASEPEPKPKRPLPPAITLESGDSLENDPDEDADDDGTPWYKEWWVWTVAGAAVIGGAVAAGFAFAPEDTNSTKVDAEVKW